MENEHKISQKAVVFILYAMMVFTMTITMGEALVLEMGSPVVLMASLGVSALMMVFLIYPLLWIAFGGFALVGGLLMNHFFPFNRIAVYEGISGFIVNLIQHVQGKEVIHPDHVLALWLLLVVGLSLLTGTQVLRKISTWPLLLVYGTSFLIYWYRHIDIAYPMIMLFLVLYLIMFSLKKFQISQVNWSAERAEVQQNLYSTWKKTAVVYGLIIVLVAALLPKTEAFVEWEWMETRLMNRFPILTDLRGSLEHSRSFGSSDYFTFASTGFQNDPQVLGGPVQLSDRLVMKVEAPAPYYLRGNIKSFYQSNTWGYHEASTKSQNIQQVLIPEVPGVINGEEVELYITYHNFSSATIFAPYQPYRVESQRHEEVTVDNNYQMGFQGGVFKDESYTLHARISNPGQLNGIEPEGLLPADYLQLPDTIGPSLIQLAEFITLGLNNNLEKALALQQYLRQYHAYSLEVPHTPPGLEFVEHFLFDLQEGYCTYFATALAVLLRLEGIPSRYVEGYLMPRDNQEGVYEVRQENAHAWVEAYFQGLGWVILEPTPAFPLPEHQQTTGVALGASGNLIGDVDAFLTLLEGLEVEGDSSLNRDNSSLESPIPAGERGGESFNAITLTQRFNQLVIALISSIFFGIFLRIVWVKRRFSRYKRQLVELSTRSQVLHLYGNILELLALLEFPAKGGETPYEFSKRITKQLYDMEHCFEKLTEAYVLAQYSQEETSPEEPTFMSDYLNYIDRRNRHKLGIVKYVWAKYLRNDYYSTLIKSD